MATDASNIDRRQTRTRIMKLVFHKGKNVGDAINPAIFEHFLGSDFFDENDDESLIGIGSLLGLKRDLAGRKIVFSSGWGGDEGAKTYGELPVVDEDWEFIAVRGPLTAQFLGLDKNVPTLDGAYLLPEAWPRTIASKPRRIGFVPHHKSLDFYDSWAGEAEKAGFHLLDVTLPPRQFIEELWTCEKVYCEAMHGAIFADAYRIPWVPIRLYPHINEYKWMDWQKSLDISPFSLAVAKVRLHKIGFMTSVVSRKTRLPGPLAGMVARVLMLIRRRRIHTWLKSLIGMQGALSDDQQLEKARDSLRRSLLSWASGRKRCFEL